MTRQELTEMYQGFLSDEGYQSRLDEDGDVLFKFEGKTYIIILDEKDEVFFRLAMPNFWPIESEEERAKVVQAAVFATGQTKVAKVFPVRDTTWATIEMFFSPPEGFKPVFQRALSALRAGVNSFVSKMRE